MATRPLRRLAVAVGVLAAVVSLDVTPAHAARAGSIIRQTRSFSWSFRLAGSTTNICRETVSEKTGLSMLTARGIENQRGMTRLRSCVKPDVAFSIRYEGISSYRTDGRTTLTHEFTLRVQTIFAETCQRVHTVAGSLNGTVTDSHPPTAWFSTGAVAMGITCSGFDFVILAGLEENRQALAAA